MVCAFSRSVPRPREIRPLLERAGYRQIGIRRRRGAQRLVGRFQPHAPERRVGRIHDEPPQPIFGVASRCGRADQSLPAGRHLGFGLHQVERRRLADVHARAVLPYEIFRELERALVDGDVRLRGLERPVRGFHGRGGLSGRLAHADLGVRQVSLRDDVLHAGGIQLSIPEQRLRKRHLQARLEARLERREQAVGGRAGRVPRGAARAAPLEPLTDPGGQKRSLVVETSAVPESGFDDGMAMFDRPNAERTAAGTRSAPRSPVPLRRPFRA